MDLLCPSKSGTPTKVYIRPLPEQRSSEGKHSTEGKPQGAGKRKNVVDPEANDAEIRKRHKAGGDVSSFTVKELSAFLEKAGAGAEAKGKKEVLVKRVKAILEADTQRQKSTSRLTEIMEHRVSRVTEDVHVEDRVETHRVDRAELLVRYEYEAWIPLEEVCATNFNDVSAYLQPKAAHIGALHSTLFKRGTLESADGVKHDAYVVAHDLDDEIIQCPYVITTSDDDKGDYTQEELNTFLTTGNLKI
jgi:hypothetical protein